MSVVKYTPELKDYITLYNLGDPNLPDGAEQTAFLNSPMRRYVDIIKWLEQVGKDQKDVWLEKIAIIKVRKIDSNVTGDYQWYAGRALVTSSKRDDKFLLLSCPPGKINTKTATDPKANPVVKDLAGLRGLMNDAAAAYEIANPE